MSTFQLSCYPGLTLFLIRVQHVPAAHFLTFTAQLVEAGCAPDIGFHTKLLTKNIGSSANLFQNGATTHQLNTWAFFLLAFGKTVQTFQDTFSHTFTFWHSRLNVVFVHGGDVVVNIFLFTVHTTQAILNDHCQLITVGWIIADAVRHGAGQNVAVAVLVLQTFTVQGGTTSGCTNHEAAGLNITSRPCQVTRTLEAEHGVVGVERNHRDVVVAVGGCSSNPGSMGTRFVDTFFQNLASLGLFVEHQLIGILWLVLLAVGRVNAQLTEHAFHTKGTGFVRNNRYDVLAKGLILHQHAQNTVERHGGGDCTTVAAFQHSIKGGQLWNRQMHIRVTTTLRNKATQLLTTLTHINHFRAIRFWLVVRNTFKLIIFDRQVETITEVLQIVDRQFLNTVGHVGSFAGCAGAVALNSLGQNNGWCAFVVYSGVVCSVNLVWIVTTTVQLPDILIRQVFHHLQGFWIATEEVFTGPGTAFVLAILIVAVHGFIHQLLQNAVFILCEQRIPMATPGHFQNVPACATEHAFQFLNDLAVTTNRAIQTLQVTVHHKHQVIQMLTASQRDSAEGFWLIHLTVAEECPDLTALLRHHFTVDQVLHKMSLIDRLQWAKAHRYSWELPEVRHQPGVRVGRQTLAIHFGTEAVHLLWGNTAFQESTGVNTWSDMALIVNEVAIAIAVRPMEEIVVANVIKSGTGGK